MTWVNAVVFRYRLLRVRAKRERLRRAEWMVGAEIPTRRRPTWLLLPNGVEHPVLPMMLPARQDETERGTTGRG